MLDQLRIHTVNSANVNNVSNKLPSYIWDADDIVNYQQEVNEKFTKIVCPLSQCDCAFPCINSDHKRLISALCDQITFLLKDAAREAVKKEKTNVTKPYWSEELSKLKRLSIEAHTVWVMHGRPYQGIINDNRLPCKSRFKKAIRQIRCNFD